MSAGRFLHVVGTRPNFMKAAPVVRALEACGTRQILVHTGQHYDASMSDVFFQQLGLRPADVNLGVGSGSHGRQTGDVMVGLEQWIQEQRPDTVVVYGDVNSTVAAALVAAKAGIRLAHVEAGLRSGDRSMPEEINRLVTDRLSDLLFTPSADGDENLLREGVDASRIHRVGNVMIDTLVRLLPRVQPDRTLRHVGLSADSPFVLVTLHRPSNVDDPEHLRRLIAVLAKVAAGISVVFPMHPRTRARIELEAQPSGLLFVDPLGYLDFLGLQTRATVVVTDSGGIQEETTFLGVPCLTVRDNTERPITVTVGTNRLVGRDPDVLHLELRRVLDGDRPSGRIPPLWDGSAAERIARVMTGQATFATT